MCCGATEVHKSCLEDWFKGQSTCIFCRKSVDLDIYKSESRVVATPVKGAAAHSLMHLKSGGSRISDSVKKRRQTATDKKTKRQAVQRLKMMSRHRDALADVSVGTLVNLKMDYRDITHPRGVNAVVFSVSPHDTGSVAVVTTAGVIAHGPQKKLFYVPSDRYKVLHEDSVVSPKLVAIQSALLDGTFRVGDHPHVTMQQAHSLNYNRSTGARLKCKCKTGICKNCRCAKAGEACTSGCTCNGSCSNPNN